MDNSTNGVVQPITTLGQGLTGIFDRVKTPVFWFAAGFVTSIFVMRKKSKVVKI